MKDLTSGEAYIKQPSVSERTVVWKGESARLGNWPPVAGLVLFNAHGLALDTRG